MKVSRIILPNAPRIDCGHHGEDRAILVCPACFEALELGSPTHPLESLDFPDHELQNRYWEAKREWEKTEEAYRVVANNVLRRQQ